MIPQELVNHIVWEVGNNQDIAERKSTLKACALASWSFLEPSRQLLFQEILLHEDSGEDDDYYGLQLRPKLERFLDVLQQNHSLGTMVKSLVIRLSTARNLINSRDEAMRDQNAQSAILPSILNFLTHVQSLHLTFEPENQDHNWKYIDTPLQEALFDFCASRPITHLKLSLLEALPIPLITKCSQLTSFTVLEEVNFAKCIPNTAQTTLHTLKSLTIKQSAAWIFPPDWMEQCHCSVPHLDLSNLQRLEFSGQMLRKGVINAPSLTYLCVTGTYFSFASSFGIDERFENIESPVSLDEWQNLKILEFNWIFATTDIGPGLGVLPLITSIKFGNPASVPRRSPIDTLIINAVWYCCTRRNEMDRFMPSAGWNDIDSTLTRAAFPNLRAIKLNFNMKYYQTSTAAPSIRNYLLDKVEKKLPELLPSIMASNLIQVGLEITVVVTSQRLERDE